MKFVRAINNNAGIATDDAGRDVVIFGKGLAFSLKSGDQVPNAKVERIFREQDASMLESILEGIPQDYFDLTCEIIDYIQSNLDMELGNSLYVTLMDHISFIKERADAGMLPGNSLTWEISRYYPEEFHLGKRVVELLEDELAIRLNDDEAASIALHVINAENDLGRVQQSMKAVRLMDDILEIIRFQIGLDMQTDSVSYQRLVVHVKFFVQRVLLKVEGREPKQRGTDMPSDEKFAAMIRENYPRALDIADRVCSYVATTYDVEIADDETTYLTINIQRVLKEGGAA